MTPDFRSEKAKRNLRRGVKKMKKNTTSAAQVRLAFRVGRPAKYDQALHPATALGKACEMFDNLRGRMKAAGLSPDDVTGGLVYSFPEKTGTTPGIMELEPEKIAESLRKLVSVQGLLPIGILFRQFDAETKKQVTWTYHFLSGTPALETMKRALELQMKSPTTSTHDNKRRGEHHAN